MELLMDWDKGKTKIASDIGFLINFFYNGKRAIFMAWRKNKQIMIKTIYPTYFKILTIILV